jgi:potassium efflux system protein
MKTRYRLLRTLLLFGFLFLNTETLFAQPDKNSSEITPTAEVASPAQTFDMTNANKSLNTLKGNAETPQQIPKELQADILTLTKLQEGARKCVDANTILLNKLNQRLTEIKTMVSTLQQPKDAALTEEQKYLDAKKEELSSQLSECRLFGLRAEELNLVLAQKLRKMVTMRLLYAYPNIFETLKTTQANLDKIWSSFDMHLFLEESGFAFFTNKNIPLLLLPLCIILVTFYSHKHLNKKIIPLINNTTQTDFSHKFKDTLIAVLRRYFPIFSGAMVLAIFFSIFTHSLVTPSYLALTSYAFLVYIFYLAFIRFYFYPPRAGKGFTTLPKPIAKKMMWRLNQCGLLALIAYATTLVMTAQPIGRPLTDLFRSLFVTLFSIYFILIACSIKNFPARNFLHKIFLFFSYFFLVLFVSCALATEYLGYHLLAFYLLFGISMTVIVIFFTGLLSKLISSTLDTLQGKDLPWQQKLRAYFGLKRNERLIEIIWLRVALYIVLYLGFVVSILKIWGLAQANFQIVVNYLLAGFDIGKLHIIPLRIIEGTLSFIVLSLITRWFRTYIIKNANWQLEGGSRESLASIFGYVGFAIAFILGMLIAGVDFSGVPLIAGALAVGIGFGLQNIVNNFASGIILLIERPIKLGDRITIGSTEGHVRKISLRSTHITTLELADLIVPNAELISQQVVNYMLHDLRYKISIKVGIAYGSDTDLAKNILLSLAKTHPDVINDRKEIEPNVYFRTFGDSSLNFELFCVVQDVNKRVRVISDLHFAIEKAFKEKGIEVPFPQRDIHITHSNMPLPSQEK